MAVIASSSSSSFLIHIIGHKCSYRWRSSLPLIRWFSCHTFIPLLPILARLYINNVSPLVHILNIWPFQLLLHLFLTIILLHPHRFSYATNVKPLDNRTPLSAKFLIGQAHDSRSILLIKGNGLNFTNRLVIIRNITVDMAIVQVQSGVIFHCFGCFSDYAPACFFLLRFL